MARFLSALKALILKLNFKNTRIAISLKLCSISHFPALRSPFGVVESLRLLLRRLAMPKFTSKAGLIWKRDMPRFTAEASYFFANLYTLFSNILMARYSVSYA
jgi:hypothetical protein